MSVACRKCFVCGAGIIRVWFDRKLNEGKGKISKKNNKLAS
jgi:hypothetical protein